MKIYNVVQNTPEWHDLRCGKPTASCFGKIITPKTLKAAKSDYHIQLASEILYGHDADEWLGNEHTEHGHACEINACEQYSRITGQETFLIGFVTNDNETIGCSPDRFIGLDGMIEIKALMAKSVVKIYCEWLSSGECPSDYKMQIQGQLMITGRKWCDLVLYHPRVTKIIRVLPDFDLHEKLYAQLKVLMMARDKAVAAMADF